MIFFHWLHKSRCSQWWKFYQNENIGIALFSLSVCPSVLINGVNTLYATIFHGPDSYLVQSLIWSWTRSRDHSCYGLSQWEMVLHCNVISHWLSPYLEWSLKHCGLLRFTLKENKHIHDINSLVTGGCNNDFKLAIPKHMTWFKFTSTLCKIALRWMPQIKQYWIR